MNLRKHILFISIAVMLCSCANNTDASNVAEVSSKAAEAASPTAEAVLDSTTKKDLSINTEQQVTDVSTESIAEKTEDQIKEYNTNADRNYEPVDSPRTRSTIAQQQEAARKIQEELAARNPKPNEDQVLEKAVFEKVISTKKEKKTTAVTEKPKADAPIAEKKKAVKAKPKKSTSKARPAIEFAEMKMAFDTISQGDIVDYKFEFTNTGKAPLEIKSAAASCGCTQPSFPFIPIEPNETGHISVRYNSVGKEGFQNPEITVKTNVDSKEIILFMEGFVKLEEKEEEGSKN